MSNHFAGMSDVQKCFVMIFLC